jgi:hypothetical protein
LLDYVIERRRRLWENHGIRMGWAVANWVSRFVTARRRSEARDECIAEIKADKSRSLVSCGQAVRMLDVPQEDV